MKKLTLTILLCLMFCGVSVAQESALRKSENLIALKFSAYTVEQDKLLHEELNKFSDYKITYACIPAGIVIIEADHDIVFSGQNGMEEKIKKISTALHFVSLQGYTQQQAEEACVDVRNVQNTNSD